MSATFRIKICGITNVEDALAVARADADAVGLNFYAKSPRCVRVEHARQIVEALPARIVKVGVFVNASCDEVCRTFDRVGLDLIQVHGDEPPEFLSNLGARPAMRAFRLLEGRLAPILEYLERCRELGCLPRMILIDSHRAGAYGGTGALADWTAAAGYPAADWHPPLVLAGGLGPENVAQAICAVRPAGVDTASGVELEPGWKSEILVRQFVEAAREGFAAAR